MLDKMSPREDFDADAVDVAQRLIPYLVKALEGTKITELQNNSNPAELHFETSQRTVSIEIKRDASGQYAALMRTARLVPTERKFASRAIAVPWPRDSIEIPITNGQLDTAALRLLIARSARQFVDLDVQFFRLPLGSARDIRAAASVLSETVNLLENEVGSGVREHQPYRDDIAHRMLDRIQAYIRGKRRAR